MPTDSIIEGTRNRNRKLMAKSLVQTPGVGEVAMQQPDPRVALQSHELYRQGLQSFLGQDQAGAQAQWQKALQVNPADMEARRGLERLSQARQVVAPTQESAQDYRQGLAQFLQGDEMGAAQGWQKAYAADSGNTEAKRGLQRILMKLMQGQR